MVAMYIAIVACVAVVLAAIGALAWSAKRSFEAAAERVAARQLAERETVLAAALAHVDVLNRTQMDAATRQVQAEVETRHRVIDSSLDEVRNEIRTDLNRLGELVAKMGESSAQRFGQVDASLRSHAEVAHQLADSTRTLREALANPQARGQWGERMAEDVLRLAGFTEHVNYHKQTADRRQRRFPPRLHVRPAQGPRALHGRQVPDGVLPAVSRGRHRRGAGPAPAGVPARRARPRQGAGQARVRSARAPSRPSTTSCCSCPTSSSPASSTSTIRRCSTMPSASAS